jgi:predicted glutamine amidotransferase
MCELLAIVANRDVGVDLSWAGHQMGAANNPDGWGAAWLAGDHFKLRKEPSKLPLGRKGRDLVSDIRSIRFLGHTRYRVQGKRSLSNTQPFVSADGRYAFAGTMQACLGRRGFRGRVQHRLKGETGPEVLFQFMLEEIEQRGLAGMRQAVKEFFAPKDLPDGASASFVFCAQRRVFVFRHRKPLHYCHRAGPYNDNPVYLRGNRHHQYKLILRGSKAPAKRATIIATEKLTGELWKEVPDRTLFLVTPNGLRTA